MNAENFFHQTNCDVFVFRIIQVTTTASGINAKPALTNAIMLKPSDAKINPLSKLPNAEAKPTNKSLKPCVRARSAGESWSANKVEPPTKQKFQPSPNKNN